MISSILKSEVINDKDIGDLYEVSFKGQADCLEKIFFMGNCLALPSVLMKTEIMKEIGGFNLGYMQSHDFDYWVRVAKEISNICYARTLDWS